MKPKEDGCCGCHQLCLGGAFFKKVLAMSSFLTFVHGMLIKKKLGSMLVKKFLAMSSLLSLTSGFLVKKALAGCCLVVLALVFPQYVHDPLPVLVGLFCLGATPGKDRSPQWQWWQKPCGLVVFGPGLIQPIVIEMGASIPFVVHPVGGAWGRLAPFELQPTRRIDGFVCGQRQMSWQ